MKLDRMSNDEYHSRKNSLSSSDLKALAKSPKTWMMSKKTSKQMDLGSCLHDFILEGMDRSLVLPKVNRTKKNEVVSYYIHLHTFLYGCSTLNALEGTPKIDDYKKEIEKFEKELSKDHLLIDEAQKQALEAMKESFYSHPEAASYLNRQDEHGVEESFEVDARDLFDTDLDVKIRIRPDYYNITEGYAADLKSTRSANKFDFKRDMWKFGYHASASLYMRVLDICGIKTDSFFLLATENQEPHCTEVYRLSEETLAEGWQVIIEGWRRYEEYIAGGYLGYHGGVVEL